MIDIHQSRVDKIFGFRTWIPVTGALLLQGYSLHAAYSCSRLRAQLLNRHFLKKYVPELESELSGQPIPSDGFPDDGNGIYAKQLSFSDWHKLNVELRLSQQIRQCSNVLCAVGIVAGFGNEKLATGSMAVGLLGMAIQGFQTRRGRREGRTSWVGWVLSWGAVLSNLYVIIQMFLGIQQK